MLIAARSFRSLPVVCGLAVCWCVARADAEVLATSNLRWGDEPDELSWEHFADSLACFRDYQSWVREQAREGSAGGSAIPESFWTVWIEGEAFGTDGEGGGWHARELRHAPARDETSGGMVAELGNGHNSRSARLRVKIPEAGRYRLWTRYWDQSGGHGSFAVRVLPKEHLEYEFGWQDTLGGPRFRHKFDFVPYKRDDAYVNRLAERKLATPARFVWECSPMVTLPAGPVCLEISGLIHSGPYRRRYVDVLVLTQDPLHVPKLDDAPTSGEGGGKASLIRTARHRPAPETVEAWPLWAVRPGTAPLHEVPDRLASLWRQWRTDLLYRLADGVPENPELDRLAQRVHFDERWNLIGTPRQVREQIQAIRGHIRASDHWYWTFEAEDMETVVAGWEEKESGSASGGAILQAHYCDGRAEAETTLAVPHEGGYSFWVRHARIKNFYNIFRVRLEPLDKDGNRGDGEVVELSFGDAEVSHGGYRQAWFRRAVELAKGRYRVVLAKNRGKGPYAYRKVDAFLLADNQEYQPEGAEGPPIGAEHARALFKEGADGNAPRLGLWQPAETWEGFAMRDVPGKGDVVRPQTLRATAARGAVRSSLLHVRNLGDEPVVLSPRVAGALEGHVSWRAIAYQLSKKHGWQPMPLLQRRTVTAPPHCNASLWLTWDARKLAAGVHRGELRLGDRSVELELRVEEIGYEATPRPLVGGWAAPYPTEHAWRMFADAGFTLLHRSVLPKSQAEALGIRRYVLPLGIPKTDAEVQRVVSAFEQMGLTTDQWSWELFDEPSDKSVDRWVAGAKAIDKWGPEVSIWCNPGTRHRVNTETIRAMAPFVDVFCPYINHFRPDKAPEHTELVKSIGTVKLFYTTPCFDEKAPHAPKAMLALADHALALERDGWNFFCVKNYYDYATGPWDDINAPFAAQAVSIYPGAHGRAISTRNLEAVREAIRRWRRARLPSRKDN